ncbi:MAG: hypothetical protein ABSA75_03315 [Candidatus Bathyarchaeia archaeon]
MVETHRVLSKNFEAELWIDDMKLPLNHMMQETLANIIEGFSKTLKGTDVTPEKIEVKIKRLHEPVDVDAHTYPQ